LLWFARLADGASDVMRPNVRVSVRPDAVFDDPQIVVGGASGTDLYVVYGAVVPGGGEDAEDIKATFSLDGGATWMPPVQLNDDASCATHWHPAAVADGAGNLWAIWYDVRFGDGRLQWAKATRSGSALMVADHGWLTDATPAFTTSRTSFFLGDYVGLA